MNYRFRRRDTPHRSSRDGFILLTTILIIAMVSILTVGIVRQSMNMASAARASQREVQEKWGAASCHRFALANQGQLLNPKMWDGDAQSWITQPIAQSESSFELGGLRFNVQLSDESAKLSLNRIYSELGRQKTAELARRFVRHENLRVDLKPMSTRQQRGPVENEFESWGQVFAVRSGKLRAFELRDATNKLTCWGNQLNYRTADESILTETCKPIIGAAMTQKLVDAISSDDASAWEEELTAAGVKREQIQSLKQMLTPRSSSQSVWVESISQHRRRNWLVVREQIASSIHRIHSFMW